MKAILKNLSLSIYKPQFFSVLSIVHRFAVVTAVLALYVFALTYSASAFFACALLLAFHLLYVAASLLNIVALCCLLGFVMLSPSNALLFCLCFPFALFFIIK